MKPHITDSRIRLLRALRRSGCGLVAVDGTVGTGKTTLARNIARCLRVRPVHLDHFLTKRRGTYLRSLRYKRLRNVIQGKRSCVVEGICVLQVLIRIGRTPDRTVYVKRVRHEVWEDEGELCPTRPLDQHLDALLQQSKQVSGFLDLASPESIGITEEIITYHVAFEPHKNADFVFVRRNDA